MTKHEMTQPKIIPGFDALKMKQELQERVYRETEGMTDAEVREYINSRADEYWRRRAERKARQQKNAAPQLVGQ